MSDENEKKENENNDDIIKNSEEQKENNVEQKTDSAKAEETKEESKESIQDAKTDNAKEDVNNETKEEVDKKESESNDKSHTENNKNEKDQGDVKSDDSDGSTEESEEFEFMEKVISIKRITKVTKGGKKLSFSALVVVGDSKGNVGYSLSKAAEVATAIRKAMTAAKKRMINVPMRGSTITHEVIGQCSGSRVLLKPASEGTGVIASGPVRAVCDGAGIHNILTKCHRSNNPINVVKATIEGLSRLKRIN